MVVVEQDPANPRRKLVRLTQEARISRDAYVPLAAEIERRWRSQFGPGVIGALRAVLEPGHGDPGADLPHFVPGTFFPPSG
jgi:hypothetical protein